MKRRAVIKNVLLGGTALVILPAVFTRCSDDNPLSGPGVTYEPELYLTIDLNDPAYSILKKYHGHVVIDSKRLIIANSGLNGFYAASSQCTHNGCTLQFVEDSSSDIVWHCPCHSSGFDVAGKAIRSPAATNLKVYNVARTNDILTIKS